MLRLGEQNIKGLCLGGQEIKKAYLGESLVFNGAKPSRLPEGYKEVRYIESPGNGNQKIKTDRIATIYSRIVAEFEILEGDTSASPNYRALIYSNSTSYSGGIYTYSGIRLIIRNGGLSAIIANNADTSSMGTYEYKYSVSPQKTLINIDFPAKKISINDEIKSVKVSSGISVRNPAIYLMGWGKGDSYKCRLYSYKYYYSDVMYNDMVPCINPSGIVGLYDLVNNIFYQSETTDTFTAGPRV